MPLDSTRPGLRSLFAVGIALLTACSSGTTTETPDTGIAGSWSTQAGAQTGINFQLALTGSALSGMGTITVPLITPISGPATPAYSGDDFTITGGNFNSPNLSFNATLGANPDGAGGFYRGTLSFTGSLNAGTISGTLTFTPPRTRDQTFAAQTVTGATLTKPR